MFSPQIVESEEFLTMPVSSQALYFHLGMNADDDGFIQPKIVMRTTGANDDDLKVLLSKRFLLPFQSGVVVIKHWLIHNLIQKDRYHPTRFQEEKKALFIKENKAYTDSVNKMLPEVRLGKVSNTAQSAEFSIEEESPARKKKEPAKKKYDDLCDWMRFLTGAPLPNRAKQYAHLAAARVAEIDPTRLKARAEELWSQDFYRQNGMDWGAVVSSFNRKA